MPTYEYRCPEGHDFERFYRKISDAQSQVTCPECGKVADRIMSAGAGLVFKGSGFYLTDYGKNAHRKPGGEAAAKSSESGGDSAGGEKTVSAAKPVDGKSSESSGTTSDAKSSASGTPSSNSPKSDK